MNHAVYAVLIRSCQLRRRWIAPDFDTSDIGGERCLRWRSEPLSRSAGMSRRITDHQQAGASDCGIFNEQLRWASEFSASGIESALASILRMAWQPASTDDAKPADA